MKMFPIMPPVIRMNHRRASVVAIPLDALAPHEAQAVRNHDQSLARLAERGGLSPCEAIAIIEGRRWHEVDADEARDQLIALAGAERVEFGRRY